MTAAGGIRSALAAGVRFLLGRQEPDGGWTEEWTIPSGPSTEWATAYVGLALCEIPANLDGRLAAARSRAAASLLRRQRHDGGWSYNSGVDTDADSTATAILMLRTAGADVPAPAYQRLTLHQRGDGGFGTYVDGIPTSWTASHPDVTPTCLRALLTAPHPERYGRAVRRGVERVRGDRTRDGLWHSFWWDTPLYGTWASMSLLRVVGRPVTPPARLLAEQPSDSLGTGLLVSCLAAAADRRAVRGALEDRVEQLLSLQCPDGSWPAVPALRITRRDCFAPWDRRDPGPTFPDTTRLFTTATTVRALTNLGR